jgi:hypothetical protein
MENEQCPDECIETIETVEPEQKTQILNVEDVLCPPRKNCAICNSPWYRTVNDWKRQGKTLREMSALCLSEFDMEVSKDLIGRHFNRYNELMRAEVSQLAFEDFKRESQDLALHQKQTLFLMSHAFNELLRRIDQGTLQIGIEDYDRLTKMYYTVLNNPQGEMPDVVEILMRASKYRKVTPLTQSSFEFGNEGATDHVAAL